MSVSAILRFAPVFDPRILDDPSLPRDVMVQRGAFTTMKSDGEIPVVVDHDMNRVVGRVTHLRTDEYGGLGNVDWWAAHVDITDPPGWLRSPPVPQRRPRARRG